jgi:AbrB family looped-hinge helix DNA binding protein
MATSTVTSKGQVTIPKEIRTRLGLKPGDRLDFHLDDQGELKVRFATEPTYLRLFGLLRHRAGKRPVTIEEMHRALKRRAADKLGRPR